MINLNLDNWEKSKGFTLLELTIVIAIVGIALTIIIVNINQARNKAFDARAIKNLNDLQTYASEYYIENDGNFDNFCSSARYKSISKNIGGSLNVACRNSESNWCAVAKLKFDSNSVYCVDSIDSRDKFPRTTAVASCAADKTCQ